MLAEEGEHLAPAIHRLLRPIERPVPIEKAVAGTVVAVELVRLAVLLELGLVLVHLLRARCAILVAEQAEQRAAEVLRHVDRRDGRLGIELLLAHHHTATPQLGASVDVRPLAGIDEGVPPTRAGAEETNLAVVIGLRAHPRHGGFGIADHLGVVAAATLALVQVRADREMAVMREPTRRLDVELAPARKMVDKHDARKGARTRWLGHVSRYRRSFVAFDGHVLAGHASVERHRSSSMGLGRRSIGPSERRPSFQSNAWPRIQKTRTAMTRTREPARRSAVPGPASVRLISKFCATGHRYQRPRPAYGRDRQ